MFHIIFLYRERDRDRHRERETETGTKNVREPIDLKYVPHASSSYTGRETEENREKRDKEKSQREICKDNLKY